MRNQAILLLVVLAIGACGPSPAKNPKLNREILGEELEFGRQAAKYDLWNEAIFRWEKVVSQDPDNSKAINNLAVAYESVGNYDKAHELYRKALELNEDSTEIRKNYKRFLNFYKKHQKQIEREKRKAAGETVEPEPQDSDEEGDQ
ncbi:MAG: tetratricopeptide repeat protein [Acidobacteria bacterium]|nr:tetratricopeptide repeat protein [Acidobacteriota bacterium]MCB9399705.1 tetratricopeptide repeat protein [Acidobacteriota bacterium]